MAKKKGIPQTTRFDLMIETDIKLFAAENDLELGEAIEILVKLGLEKKITLMKIFSSAGNPGQLHQLSGLLLHLLRVLKMALKALRDPHVISPGDNESVKKEETYIARFESAFDEILGFVALVRSFTQALLHLDADRVEKLRNAKQRLIRWEAGRRDSAEKETDEKKKAEHLAWGEEYRMAIELFTWFGI